MALYAIGQGVERRVTYTTTDDVAVAWQDPSPVSSTVLHEAIETLVLAGLIPAATIRTLAKEPPS
jgi:hypothetical protein